MATVKSLLNIPFVLLVGWLLSIAMLLVFPYVTDSVQLTLNSNSILIDVSGNWAEITIAETFFDMIYVVCFLPGVIGTGAAILYSTKKTQSEYSEIEYSGTYDDNQFSSVQEFE